MHLYIIHTTLLTYTQATDLLLAKMKDEGVDFSKIVSLSGAGQVNLIIS